MGEESIMKHETVFTLDTSSIKFGPGATQEVGYDMKRLGSRKVMVATDPKLVESEPVSITLDALHSEGIDTEVFDQVHIEPTDASFKEAIKFASEGRFDGYVAVGGGSSMDTAKAANLYATYPAEFLVYVNPPIGRGQPVPGRLKPMIAIPTTAGTGSETTGVAIFDFLEMHAKTGIAHRALRPDMGIVDPSNTRTLPKMVAACTGLDVLSHALESLTALPFGQRQAPEHISLRPAYQGANPISDVWAERAIRIVSNSLIRVLKDPSDDEARAQMLLAATFAGIGFGNAGVHLPHAMSYPVSGMVRDYVPEGYPSGHPLVPHGMAVVLNAPACFRYTARVDPQRHLRAAKLIGADVSNAKPENAGSILTDSIINLMRESGMPNGLSAIGFGSEDLDQLVAGTISQHRLTKISPRPVDAAILRELFLNSMTYW
jgi:hydroxyacid-oxoacid transhydrogenase